MKRAFFVFVLGCVGLACVAGQTTAVPTPNAVMNATAVTLELTNTPTPEPVTKQPATINTEPARPIHTTKETVIVPSYQVKNSDGRICILMEFNFDLKIAFKTQQGDSGNSTVNNVGLGAINTAGNCSGDDRTVLLTVVKYTEWRFRFEFAKQGHGATFELKKAVVHWKYEEPFFSDKVDTFGETEAVELKGLDIRATTGKTFKCATRSQRGGPATFTMNNIMIQPYAQESSDKGKYGEVESCSSSSSSGLGAGAIIGIIAGVLLVVVVVAGGVVLYCRNQKKSQYTSV